MQENSMNFDRTFYESTSTEDDCKYISPNIDSVNRYVHQSQGRHQHRNIRLRRKLLKIKLPVQSSDVSARSSDLVEEKVFPNQTQHEVTSTKKAKYLAGESRTQNIIRTKRELRERSGTPRIVQVIGGHSGSLSVKREGISPSPVCRGGTKDDCSVVPCQSGKSHHSNNQHSSKSPRNSIRISKSDQTILTSSLPSNRKNEDANYCSELSSILRRQSNPPLGESRIPPKVDIVRESEKCQKCKPGSENMTQTLLTRPQHASSQIGNNTKDVFSSQPTTGDPERKKVDTRTEVHELEIELNDEKPAKIENHEEVEQRQQICNQQEIAHQLQSTNEVPLSSLGFNTEEPIDWENIILPQKTDLYHELAKRIKNYKNADFIIRIGIDEFHCHLLVLQSYSTFFDEQNCKEIKLPQNCVTCKAFGIIYDWMISAINETCHLLCRNNVLEILMSAQYLGIKELEEQCWAFIGNDELFYEDTAFLLYLEAKKKENTAVMELMVPRIKKFFLLLVGTKDFLELSADELCSLLNSNHISINSEMDVLMSAIRWLMCDWTHRKQYMLDIVKCVRFGLIAPWQLIDVRRNPKNPEFMKLMAFEEVRKMVDDGLAFAIIKYWYGDQTVDYYHWINLLGLTEPTNRNWAGEDKNYMTYQEFIHYLDDYQRTIMPELKVRRSTSMPSNQQQCSELQQSNEADDNCYSNHCAANIQPSNQVNVTTDNTTRAPMKLMNTTVKSSTPYAPPSVNTASASMHIAMPREFITEYSTTHDSNAKTDVCNDRTDNGNVKIDNALIHHHSRLKPMLNISRGNGYDSNFEKCTTVGNNIHCNYQLEPNIVIEHGKHLRNVRSMRVHTGDHIDSLILENNAAMKIQAHYRGYRTRRKLNKLTKMSSSGDQHTKDTFELLLPPANNDELQEILECIRTENAFDTKSIEKKYPVRNSYEKPSNSSLNQINVNEIKNASEDFDKIHSGVKKFDEIQRQKDSDPKEKSKTTNTSISHLTQTKSLYMNNSTTLLYNFNGRSSSATSSENANTDEPSSPIIRQSKSYKYKNFVRPKSEYEGKISTNKLEKVENYFPDYSLFYSECECVLVFGGIDLHSEYGVCGNTGKDIYRYRPRENIWEFVGEIPEPRHHHSTIYLNGRVYLVGGADPREDQYQEKSPVVGTVWSYDPARRQWFNEPELLTPRQNFSLVVIQGKIFVIGGQDKNGYALRSVEVFDPFECKWRKIQPMNKARVGAACANFQDCIWVAGGMRKSEVLEDVECYDLAKNMWHKIEPLRTPRCFATLYTTSNRLYLIGGVGKLSTCDNITESIKTIDIWDSNLQTWRQLTEMSIARHKHCVGTVGNQLLIIGGITTVYMKTLKSIECFCYQRSKWIKGVASLPYAISGHDSVSLPPSNQLKNHRV